uniref:Biogenesis of lysosome-related organelles complex 1 subunit 1 n=2 Tax=Kalanchoe fedtschenkoi TaxID=63787 RepID=A0A7N0VM53_KALFE
MYPPQLPLARTRTAFSSDTASSNRGELEESLLLLIHEHNHFSLKLRDSTEKAKNNAIRSASQLSELLVDTVNSGVQNAFVNEERIEMEIGALTETIVRYGKQTDQWLAATQAINTAIKEIGDFENWMKMIEYDSRSVAAVIRNIHEA